MKILKKISSIAVLLFVFGLLLAPVTALAQEAGPAAPADSGGGGGTGGTATTSGTSANKDAVCEGVGLTGGSCDTTGSSNSVQTIVKQVISILSIVIGIVSVIMVMIGGFKYVTSGGDSNGINSAKNTILYAIIGLVIAALAQVLVQFVIGRVSTPAPLPKCSPTVTTNCTP